MQGLGAGFRRRVRGFTGFGSLGSGFPEVMVYGAVGLSARVQEEGAHFRGVLVPDSLRATLDTSQRKIHGFFSQLQFRCYLPEVASVED